MHELSIAQSILDIATARARAEGATRILSIRVAIGALTAYVDESLKFYWDSISEGTEAAGSEIEFVHMEGRLRCLNCAAEFTTTTAEFECPKCGGLWTHPLAGDECYVDSIEVFEEEPVYEEELLCL
jgi:hydrogenase nickel incorporation protein HypA/HybF